MTPSWYGSDQGKLTPRYGLQFYSPNTVQLARHGRRLANPLGDRICEALVPTFDPKAPTALFVGRYQPFHSGHLRLIDEGLRRVGQVCIAVRDTQGLDDANLLPFFAVKQRIEAALAAYAGRFVVISLPNITNVFYGRDVSYTVERIVLDDATESIYTGRARRLSAAP